METIKSIIGGIVIAIIIVGLFLGAVLQQSYRDYPPTEEELQDNPALVEYLD